MGRRFNSGAGRISCSLFGMLPGGGSKGTKPRSKVHPPLLKRQLSTHSCHNRDGRFRPVAATPGMGGTSARHLTAIDRRGAQPPLGSFSNDSFLIFRTRRCKAPMPKLARWRSGATSFVGTSVTTATGPACSSTASSSAMRASASAAGSRWCERPSENGRSRTSPTIDG